MYRVAALVALLTAFLPKPWGDAAVIFILTYIAATLLLSINKKETRQ